MRLKTCLLLTLLLVGGLLVASCAFAESIRLSVPSVLPRDCPLVGYSPLVRVSYSGLNAESYTLKLWLLEDQKYNLASTQWSERTISIENKKGGAAEGQLLLNAAMDVFDYPSFLWVARLYNSAGVEVAMAKARSKAVSTRPVLLKPVGRRVATVGKTLRIPLESEGEKDAAVTYRMQDAPSGAALDSKTGLFTWSPTAAGATTLVFEAVTGDTELTDAKVVHVDVSAPDPAVEN